MKRNTLLIILAALLLFTIWGNALMNIPTFDFDESLYRRVADEMKMNHAWWRPTMDHRPLFHKPPLLYWLMIGASYLFDQAGAVLSGFSAKFPSFVASTGILTTLYFFSEYLWQRKLTVEQKWAAPLLFASALFPIATGTSAIFDPLQTFLLLPTLLIPFKYFMHDFEKRISLSWQEWVLLSLSLFLGTALKGLNGIVVPSCAFGLHLMLVCLFYESCRKDVLKTSLQYFFYAFLPAAFACFLYFYFLDVKMGRAFTQEFFWVHHFGRSTEAMETHGGGLFYHPLAAWIGGGFLSSYLFISLFKTKIRYLTEGFALSYFLAFLIVFSLTATKLPHYTWPIWPALALAGSVFAIKPMPVLPQAPSFRLIKWIGSLPILFFAFCFLFLILNPINSILHQIASPKLTLMLADYHGIQGIPFILICAAFAVCLVFHVHRDLLIAKPIVLALANLFITLSLSVSIVPVVVDILVKPPSELAEIASSKYLKPGDCLRITSSHSPTISLALGHVFLHNRCEPSEATHLITAEWKLNECQEHGFALLEKRSYLYLCGRSP